MSKQPNKRERPFADLYESWDAPTFDPSRTILSAKSLNETENRTILSRLYETVLDSFNNVRQRQIAMEIQSLEPPPKPFVLGTNGRTEISMAPGTDTLPRPGADRPFVLGTNGRTDDDDRPFVVGSNG